MSPQAPKPPAPRPPAPQPAADRRLARDVAKHIDRRQMRRKLLWWAFLVGALVLAALYLTCGRGWGLGGKGKGKGPGEGPGPGSVQTLVSPVDAGPRQCKIRVAANGITADGKPATVDEAVAACKGVAIAEVLVTGGARVADREDLEAAFERAGIQIQIVRVKPKAGGAGTSGGAGAGIGTSDGGSAAEPTGGR